MKKIKRKSGDILEIVLADGSLSYARVLEEPLIDFFDCNSKDVLDVNQIMLKPIVFKLWVASYAIHSGRWRIIGNVPIESKDNNYQFYRQDPINKKLYIMSNGVHQPATLDDCINLECAASWDPEHIEDRLIDYYSGKPNKWVESLRIS